ncbi:unnamed protein product [Dibothriocephalus latus]|uniref:Uncharacterized protein n=1 Tax=Dibothriocephalus latus TaxID=60516 RepID=A0A3P6SNF9_DIBLA|nr:unnamed protein product [Dibothriocephalus latus]
MRGAETGNVHGSDYVLVRTGLKVYLSSAPKMTCAKCIDVTKLRGQSSTLCDSVREVNGGFTANSLAKVDRWRDHFKHLYNSDEQPITPFLSSVDDFQFSPAYAVSCEEDDVVDAMQRLCSYKASGEDGIPAEIYKSCVETLAP